MYESLRIAKSDPGGKARNGAIWELSHFPPGPTDGHVISTTNLEELSGEYLSKVMKTAREFPFFGLIYADSIVDYGTYQAPLYREPFDIKALQQRDIVSGPILINAEFLKETNYQPFDPNLELLAVWDLSLRIASKRTLLHVPEILSIMRFPVGNANQFQSEMNHIRQKFGG
jgi:hypothetical protein